MENKDLYHHGVKGMRWGVRRYQNKDGTLIKSSNEESRQINGVVKGLPMTSEEADSGKCNPNKPDRWYDRDEYNAQMAEKGGYLYNCQSCAVAYEARVRGYDVVAGSRSNNPTADMIQDDVSKAFIDPTTGKPPVGKKFDCDISESKASCWNELNWDPDTFTDPAKEKEFTELSRENYKNFDAINKSLNDNIKSGERYLAKTKTFDSDSGDYREHYMVVDWTNSKEPMVIETQSTRSYPEEIPSFSKGKDRNYVEFLGVHGSYEMLLGVELTRVDHCDLNYDVVEKVTERSKR